MFRWSPIVVVAFVLLNAVQPPPPRNRGRDGPPVWRTPGACLTRTGTLCRTLVYETSGWANRSWGFHNIERYNIRETEAVRGDGTAMIRISRQDFRFYFVSAGSYDRTRIVLPTKRQTFEIERTVRAFRQLPGLWRFHESWTDNPECGEQAMYSGKVRRKTGIEPVLAGVRAIEYAYESADRRFVQRIAFAPSLGCTAVAFSFLERNGAGLPVRAFESKLTSVLLGEPDQKLFEIPADYHSKPSDKAWPYVWMDVFHGNSHFTMFSEPVT